MSLTLWRPFVELDELRTRFDRLYDQWFDGQDRSYTPAIDVEKHDHDLTVRADAPGVKPDDVKIEVQDGVLTISGQHEERKEKQEKNYLRRERNYGSFTRTMALPEGVDAKKIKAATKPGVVEITIPPPAESKKEPVTITPDRYLKASATARPRLAGPPPAAAWRAAEATGKAGSRSLCLCLHASGRDRVEERGVIALVLIGIGLGEGGDGAIKGVGGAEVAGDRD